MTMNVALQDLTPLPYRGRDDAVCLNQPGLGYSSLQFNAVRHAPGLCSSPRSWHHAGPVPRGCNTLRQ